MESSPWSPDTDSSPLRKNANEIESEEQSNPPEHSSPCVIENEDSSPPEQSPLQSNPSAIAAQIEFPSSPIRYSLDEYTQSEIDELLAHFHTFFGYEVRFSEEEEESDEEEEPPLGEPPYYPGYHPMLEELKSRFKERPFAINLTTPVMCADPDDESTWKYFPSIPKARRKHVFSPNKLPLQPANVILGIPVFELISICILYVDPIRGFSAISMCDQTTQYLPILIYKHPKEKEKDIPLEQPLPLKGPFRPLGALDVITFALSNPFCQGWCFEYQPAEKPVYNQVVHDIISDFHSNSKARISYYLIESAATAELSVTYDPHHHTDDDAQLVILSGTIHATNTDKPQTTKRLVQDFSSETHLLNDNVLPLNRSVFGVPTTSGLQVSINLKCVEQSRPITVESSLTFMAPPKTRSDKQYVSLRAGELKVTVNWWDNMY